MRKGEIVVTDERYYVDSYVTGETEEDVRGKLEHSIIDHEVNEVERVPFLTALNQIADYLNTDAKIAAIKRVRELSGSSLIDAKRVVDKLSLTYARGFEDGTKDTLARVRAGTIS